ncbi:helix-hairpin-helix domain-containing protein [Streptomyces sp. NPDC051173]|uniref:helix-hairpin-helix domain-containing protein n=1 Tax=Streptomyces sp. NPDC051173 TaxID=3155164 RepID=UPI00345083FA
MAEALAAAVRAVESGERSAASYFNEPSRPAPAARKPSAPRTDASAAGPVVARPAVAAPRRPLSDAALAEGLGGVREVLAAGGAPEQLAVRAVETLGEQAGALLRDDPWQLLAVPGVRPEQADGFARALLGPECGPGDERRAAALTGWLLERAALEGHTVLEAPALREALAQHAVPDPDEALQSAIAEGAVLVFQEALESPAAGGRGARATEDGEEPETPVRLLLGLDRYAMAEESLADGLARLISTLNARSGTEETGPADDTADDGTTGAKAETDATEGGTAAGSPAGAEGDGDTANGSAAEARADDGTAAGSSTGAEGDSAVATDGTAEADATDGSTAGTEADNGTAGGSAAEAEDDGATATNGTAEAGAGNGTAEATAEAETADDSEAADSSPAEAQAGGDTASSPGTEADGSAAHDGAAGNETDANDGTTGRSRTGAKQGSGAAGAEGKADATPTAGETTGGEAGAESEAHGDSRASAAGKADATPTADETTDGGAGAEGEAHDGNRTGIAGQDHGDSRTSAASKAHNGNRASAASPWEALAEAATAASAPASAKELIQAVAGAGLVTHSGGEASRAEVAALVGAARAVGLRAWVAVHAEDGRQAEVLGGTGAVTLTGLLSGLEGPGRDADGSLALDVLAVLDAPQLDVEAAAVLVESLADGTRLVLSGDPGVLWSAGPGRVFADVVAAHACPAVVSRTPDPGPLGELVSGIGVGELTKVDAPGKEVVIVPVRGPGEAVHRTVQLVADSVPRAIGVPAEQTQVITPGHGGPAGTRALNAALKERLNPGPGRFGGFDPGDRVAYVPAPGRMVPGTVVSADAEGLRLDCAGTPVVVPKELVGRAVRHGWAVTAHQAAGMRWPAAVVVLPGDAARTLTRSWVYTAFGRAERHLSVVQGVDQALPRAVAEVPAKERTTRLKSLLRAQHQSG